MAILTGKRFVAIYAVKELDYVEPEEERDVVDGFFSFECVFMLLANLVAVYNQKHPSDGNGEFMRHLDCIFKALVEHDWKGCPVAKDFFDNAPKLVKYSREQAWQTINDFVRRNADELHAHSFVAAINSGDEVKRLCFLLYDGIVGK